jgi:hypothetical protein
MKKKNRTNNIIVEKRVSFPLSNARHSFTKSSSSPPSPPSLSLASAFYSGSTDSGGSSGEQADRTAQRGPPPDERPNQSLSVVERPNKRGFIHILFLVRFRPSSINHTHTATTNKTVLCGLTSRLTTQYSKTHDTGEEKRRAPKTCPSTKKKVARSPSVTMIARRARLGTHLAYGSLYSMDNHSCSFQMGFNRIDCQTVTIWMNNNIHYHSSE